jgi:hypothetical protein
MEYWSTEKNIKPLIITPALQSANTPKFFNSKILQQKSPCFGS